MDHHGRHLGFNKSRSRQCDAGRLGFNVSGTRFNHHLHYDRDGRRRDYNVHGNRYRFRPATSRTNVCIIGKSFFNNDWRFLDSFVDHRKRYFCLG